ncbi:MAG TPA: ClpXP protease specificity-enhancing factor SspB [Xanthobacteraceae bacterium]|nr:ClpXP protease specificity-enhancing factor SspB [Xanthobacteraceae bacterium]
MALDHIRYDILAQAALRGVVRTVLADAAKKGLPGEHHFKITFNTTAPGVRLSERMRARFPEEMTIVLQHQFWDLAVTEHAFEVGLSFGGIPEKVGVPFDSVTAFYDPAVQFGFQFETVEAAATADANAGPQTAEKSAGSAAKRPAGESKPDALPAPSPVAAAAPDAPGPDSPGGEVVRLDRFRKK